MKVPALLKNKYVCYALMALAALNVIGYVTVKAWECLALFALAGYSAHCYCNNVSVAIIAALFVANFVFGCGRVKEGFEDAMKGPKEHMADVKKAAEKAAEGFREGADGDGEDAANQVAEFVASKPECCAVDDDEKYTGAWKDDLGDATDIESKAAKCAAEGAASSYCIADATK